MTGKKGEKNSSAKRKQRRIIKRLETDFSAEGLSFRGISSDMSEGGLFVRTSKPFSQGTLVDLTIHLPGNVFARLKAIVRWAVKTGQMSGKNGMGLEIIDSDQNFIDFLNIILPVEERIQAKERKGTEPATGAPKKEPKAVQESVPGIGDDHIDAMISALFSKRNRE